MQRPQGEFSIFGRYQDADLDLGCRNHLDVDALVGQRLKHLLGDPGMAAHADADDRDLDDIRIGLECGETDRVFPLLQHGHSPVELGARHGEGEIGGASILGSALYDHVDVDRVVGERTKYGRRDARPVRHLLHGDLGFVAAVRDAAHNLLFHDLVFVDHQRSGGVGKARQHLHAHPVVHRHLDRARLQHLGAL